MTLREIVPWVLELIFGHPVTTSQLILPKAENQLNKIPSLVQLCTKHIAQTLYTQEMSSQRAVLDSVHSHVQKLLLLDLFIVYTKAAGFQHNELEAIASLLINEKCYFSAYSMLQVE